MAKPLVFKVGNKLKVVLFRNAVLMKPVRKESVLCSPDLLLQRSVLVSQKVLFQILKPTNGKIGDQTIRKEQPGVGRPHLQLDLLHSPLQSLRPASVRLPLLFRLVFQIL